LALLGGGGGGGLNLFFRGRLREANHPSLVEAGVILNTRCSERERRVVGGGGMICFESVINKTKYPQHTLNPGTKHTNSGNLQVVQVRDVVD
jgi:hypothetical protein